MEQTLINIIQHLQQEIDWAATIDEDYGQLENLDNDDVDMYPLTFPAILVETPNTQWTDISQRAQKGTATLRVRLMVDCYDDTHHTSDTLSKVNERQTMRHQLHQALQGYRPNEDGPMMRVSSTFATWNHGIKIYEMNYTLTLTESVSQKESIDGQKVALRLSTGTR